MPGTLKSPPEQNGIEELPDLKSWVFPKKSQRSVNSLVPLMLSTVSLANQGWPVCRVRMELSSQPSRNCAKDFFPGIL